MLDFSLSKAIGTIMVGIDREIRGALALFGEFVASF